MTNLINWHIFSTFYDRPKLRKIANIKRIDLLFKLENNMTTYTAVIFTLRGLFVHKFCLYNVAN